MMMQICSMTTYVDINTSGSVGSVNGTLPTITSTRTVANAPAQALRRA